MFSFAALGILYLLAVAWPLAKIDIREHRLPNRLVLPAFPLTFLGQLMALVVGESWRKLVMALALGILVFALSLVMNRFAALGMGDAKLFAAIAFALGWFSPSAVFYCMFLTFVFAALFVLGAKVFRKLSINRAIALGPYILSGFLVSTITIF